MRGRVLDISRRLSVLALGPQPVWPATDGGKEGIHGALDALARRVDLTYACPCPTPSPESLEHFRALGIDYCPVPFEPRDSPSVVLSSTLQLKPFKFHKYGNRKAVAAFEQALPDVQPDAVLCFHAHMAEMGQRLRRRRGWCAPLLVREHNIEYELVASYRASLPALERIATAPIEWLTRRAEHALWSSADAVAFLSDRDHGTALATRRVARPLLAPEGVPLPPRRTVRLPPGTPRLLMPLNPRATQSVANLRRFLHEYWRTAAAAPALDAFTVAVTGVDAKRLHDLTGLAPDEQQRLRIHALGFLPSLRPAFESALALVSPTFIGGGIRKKVLEGMAHQVPVIATDLDIETCSYFDPPRNILRLGAPEEFVATTAALAADAGRWQAIAEAGRDTVERHASWDGFASIIVGQIEALMVPPEGVA